MAFSLDQFYRLNRRALIWIILGVLIWLMRDFFGLIFMTFILAFIATPLAVFGERRLHLTRRISIIIAYGLFLIVLASFIKYVAPSVGREAWEIMVKLPQIQEKVMAVKNQLIEDHPSLNPIINNYMRSVLPEEELKKADAKLLSLRGHEATPAGAELGRGRIALTPAAEETSATQGVAFLAPASAGKAVRDSLEQDLLIKAWMGRQAEKIKEKIPEMIKLLWQLLATMLLALLFSFLITLDIARLREEIESLRASRLHDIYEQTAQPVVRFAYVLGRSFQAQAAIACVNAVLTMIGMLILGIPSVAMLSLIVFVCSFIPVLGVFISSTPIVLVALNTSGGLALPMWAIVMVMIIHAIEAYVLNPFIYGRHLKLNPVLVLLILFVGHHAFGVWGMVLGVPVAYYFIHDVFGVPVWGENRLPAKHISGRPLGAMSQTVQVEDRPQALEPAARAGETPGDEDNGRG